MITVTLSVQVTKWRLQCKEAEARLAELTGDQSGDAKRLVWGVADEERFRGDLDEKVSLFSCVQVVWIVYSCYFPAIKTFI